MVQHIFFFGISHAFVRVTAVTRDCLVRNSGFEAQIIADLRAILEVLPGQRYRGSSGGLRIYGRRCAALPKARSPITLRSHILFAPPLR